MGGGEKERSGWSSGRGREVDGVVGGGEKERSGWSSGRGREGEEWME